MRYFEKKYFLCGAAILVCFPMFFFKKEAISAIKQKDLQQQDVTVNISVDDLRPGITIPPNFLGLSYEVTSLTDTVYFKASHLKFKTLMTNLGSGVLRLNGYYGNFVPWSSHERTALMTKGNKYYLTDSIATSDLDSLFAFIRPTKWKLMLGVQLLNSYPARSLSEVNYAWSRGKDVIMGFEIGNEPEGLFKSNFANYYSQLLPHIQLIRSKLPQVPLCGPASVHPELFLAPFVNAAYNQVNLITYHEYPVGEDHVTNNIGQLLANKTIEKSNKTAQFINSLTESRHLPYRIGECNSFADEGANVGDRFASALWGLDYMFTVAKDNCTGINFHGGSRGFTPIIIKKGAPVTPQPLYYAMLFFHLAATGRLLPVEGVDDNNQLKAYAVRSPENKITVTLLNKNANNDSNIHLTCKSRYSKATLIRLTSSSLTGKDVTLGGSAVDDRGNWKATVVTNVVPSNGVFNVTLPKGSAALLTVSN